MCSGVRDGGEARALSVRTESSVRTEQHWSLRYCFNPETTSDVVEVSKLDYVYQSFLPGLLADRIASGRFFDVRKMRNKLRARFRFTDSPILRETQLETHEL